MFEGIMAFYVFIFIFCLEQTVKRNNWRRTISVTVMVIISEVSFWKLLDNSNVLGSFSTITRHRHLKDNLQLKILRTWIHMHSNYFLGEYHEMKIREGVMETITRTKVRACFPKNIAPRQFILFLFFQTKLIFKFNLASAVRIIFATIYLSFYTVVFYVPWSSSSVSTLFFNKN